jgi:hypothetical protein
MTGIEYFGDIGAAKEKEFGLEMCLSAKTLS